MSLSDPTIACPNGGIEIKLNESLAGPLIEATRKEYEARLAKQTADFKAQKEQLAKEREAIEQSIADTLKAERAEIAEHLDRSRHTVHVHVQNIYRKFDVNSRRDLVHGYP